MDYDLSRVDLDDTKKLLKALEQHLQLKDLHVLSQNKGLWYDLIVAPLHTQAAQERTAFIIARKEEIKERLELLLTYDTFTDYDTLREAASEERRATLRNAQRRRQDEETRYKQSENAMKAAERQIKLDASHFEGDQLEAQLRIERLKADIAAVKNPSQKPESSSKQESESKETERQKLLEAIKDCKLAKFEAIEKLEKAGFARNSDEVRRVINEADTKMYQLEQDLKRLERAYA